MIPVLHFTAVVNLRLAKYDVYIGRPGHGRDGYFGNPHPVGFCPLCAQEHVRGEAVVAFEDYFYRRLARDPEFFGRVLELHGKRLGCFCAPARCHGNVIAEFLNWYFTLAPAIRAIHAQFLKAHAISTPAPVLVPPPIRRSQGPGLIITLG